MAPGRRGDARERHRPHRPHELGPRVYRRGRWWCADLRPWDAGRITLRNPSKRGWPARGERTEDEETARRWAWAYVDHFREESRRRQLGLIVEQRPIGKLREDWARWRELNGRSWKTIQGGNTATGHLADYVGPDFPIEDVHEVLQEFFYSFLEAGYQVSTLTTMRRQLSSFFRWAKLRPNPIEEVELPKLDAGEAKDWGPEHLARIRHAADGLGHRVAVELALGTGARQSELWALELRDFSQARKTVRVVRQLDPNGSRKHRLKGGRSRTAVVLPFVWEWLPTRPGLVLHDGEGGTLKPRASRDIITQVLQAADLYETGLGWHRFRHTYARLFLEAGGWMDELQRSLGHASIRTTEALYGHFAPERAAGYAVSRIYGEGRRLRIVD